MAVGKNIKCCVPGPVKAGADEQYKHPGVNKVPYFPLGRGGGVSINIKM